jgi:hypothetical protein
LVAAADVTRELWAWACDCAERALLREREAGREPDPRSWAAVKARRGWLRGEVSEDQLHAAAAAAAYAAAYTADAAYFAAAYDANAAAAAARVAECQWQRERLAWYLDPLLREEANR